jgi:hypothetical protein
MGVVCFASHFTPSKRLRGHHTTAARPRLPVSDFTHRNCLRIFARDSARARLLLKQLIDKMAVAEYRVIDGVT